VFKKKVSQNVCRKKSPPIQIVRVGKLTIILFTNTISITLLIDYIRVSGQ